MNPLVYLGVGVTVILQQFFPINTGKMITSIVGYTLMMTGLVFSPDLNIGSKLLDYPLVTFGLAVAVSGVLRPQDRLGALLPSAQRVDGTVTQIILIATAITILRFSPIVVAWMVNLLLASSLVVCGYAILQALGKDVALPGGMPTSWFQGRAWGTMANPLFLGGYICLLLPLSTTWALGGAWWDWIPALVMGGTLYVSRTRSAIGAAAIGTCLSAFLYNHSLGIIGAVVCGGLGGFAFLKVSTRRGSWLRDTLKSDGSGRLWVWKILLEQVKKRPLFGYGYNGLWIKNPDPTMNDFYDQAHNQLLTVLHATGLVGTLCYLAIWATALWWGNPVLLPSLVAYFLWMQFAWDHVGPANVFWALLGMC